MEQEKKWTPPLGKKIGEGVSKTVHADRSDSKQVFKVLKEKRSDIEARRNFYTIKILHLLLPDSIPDISLSTAEVERVEKKPLDWKHHALIPSWNLPYVVHELVKKINAHGDTALTEKLKNLGITIDESRHNFSRGVSGEVIYLDSLTLRDGSSIKTLADAMEALPSEKKDQAQKYLSRLRELLKDGESDNLIADESINS